MDLTPDNDMTPTLTNPFENTDDEATVSTDYQAAVARGEELQALPRSAATDRNIQRHNSKNRMTVWERINSWSMRSPPFFTRIGVQTLTVPRLLPRLAP